ncbi:Uncharacterized protein APZ42_025607 [Daphnia magna]|uniref:Reverse transcriptase domain-containing protein n=1 Tax=Daphnia magna TaxID=35525 RepID=A0A162DCU3_9CRUS|nr:Uncharacterized protein APZ42_025607 [Daphnia magna]
MVSPRRSFIRMTVHWLGSDLSRRSACLAVRRVIGSHTFDVIVKSIDSIHKEFGISSKVNCTITDNGSNFLKAFKILERHSKESAEKEATTSEESDDDNITVFDTEQERIKLPRHMRCSWHLLNLIATTDVHNISNVTLKKVKKRLDAKLQATQNSKDFIKNKFGVYFFLYNVTRNSFFDAVDAADYSAGRRFTEHTRKRVMEDQQEGELRLLDDPIYRHFKMEGTAMLKHLLKKGDWMVKIDLQDAYLTVPIFPSHCKFLQFKWKGRVYEFTCLPFGLSSAPWGFTKILKPVVGFLRKNEIKLIFFLDNILILSPTKEKAKLDFNVAKELLEEIGFIINHTKSRATPGQTMEFLGLDVNSNNLSVSLPESKVDSIINLCTRAIEKIHISLYEVARMLGKFSWATFALIFSQAHYRSLQSQYIENTRLNSNLDQKVSLSKEAVRDLTWWVQNLKTVNGKPLKIVDPDLIIYSDACLSGWDGHCNGLTTRGPWCADDHTRHINDLELMAALNCLKSFAPHITNISVLLYLNNATAVAYVKKMGHDHYFCKLFIGNKQSSSSNNSDTIRLYLGQLFIVKSETRWNTWYFAIACVVRLFKKKKAMRKLFDELKIPYFKHEEESYMKEYVKIMKSVTKALDILQGDKNIGMGFLLPTISVLRANLESLKHKSSIVYCKPLIVGVLNAIHTRFHHMFWENALRLAAISNPMFRLSWLDTEAEINRAQTLLQLEFETYKEDDEEVYVSDSSSDETSSSKSGLSPEKRTKSSEKNFFSKLVNKNAKKQSFHEVDMFLKYCSDLKQLNDYPIIKQNYRRYNVALPSSASVERLFSQGGLIYTPNRLNLSDKHFEMLLFLKVNNKQNTGW